jgi:proteasome lid subunit RPN8/RPN11
MNEMEVGGFGITATDDLLFVTDIVLVRQKVTVVSVSFEDESVADFFENQVEAKRRPEQFARIWLHTHPGDSPDPSMTDEETFDRVFGICDWSVMSILAQNGNSYARLHFKAGPGGDILLPVRVDYGCKFAASDPEGWRQEYTANVTRERCLLFNDKLAPKELKNQEADIFGGQELVQEPILASDDLLNEIDSMDPLEREFFMQELAIRSQYWNLESEVF